MHFRIWSTIKIVLSVTLIGCADYHSESENGLTNLQSEGAKVLHKLGTKASKFKSLKFSGWSGSINDPDNKLLSFSASYEPEDHKLSYEQFNNLKNEKYLLEKGNCKYFINNELRENTGVKFSSVYPNQKNYQYPIRIAAPFLDALSDYSATRYTFEIYKSVDPIKKFTSDQLEWFELKIKDLKGDDIIHALLATDFQRVSGFFAGVDPSDGLIKMLYIMHKDSNNHPNSIIRISNIETQ